MSRLRPRHLAALLRDEVDDDAPERLLWLWRRNDAERQENEQQADVDADGKREP